MKEGKTVSLLLRLTDEFDFMGGFKSFGSNFYTINWFKQHKVKILFLVLGGIAGYAYWRYVGCASGTCPITSNWYSSSLYGMVCY